MRTTTSSCHRLVALVAALAVVVGMQALLAPSAGAAGFVPISGSGSSYDVLDQWRRSVANLEGITVNYAASGSTSGRNDFKAGQVDFAVSEIPYGLTDGGVLDPNPTRAFGYVPVVAGGTAFMYNLKSDNKRVTNLRLSGDTLTKIFTQQITNWADPAIKADNPGLTLPARAIVPVVRSDGSGVTAQFTAWMASQYGGLWDDYCHRAGRNITPCGFTSFYPPGPGMHAQAGSQGVAGFVAQDSSEGAITYVEHSYARNSGFPVVKVLNKANYYVEPTAGNVAVALLKAQIRPDLTSDLSQVYVNDDPRAYPLSSYSYMIIPKDTTANFTTEKGRTLSEFAAYFFCEGQQQADPLGYSPLPINLVAAGVDQINQIPGSTQKLNRNNLSGCHNPTISPTGGNLVAENAPQPQPCDRKGTTQCGTGTSGAPTVGLVVTPASPVAAGTTETLRATVTPPAAGSVQFMDGRATIGSPVAGSGATATVTTTLPPGTHSLTAVFTPTDPTALSSSTSNAVSYVVNAPPGTTTTTTVRVVPNRAFQGIPVILLANVAPRGAAGTVQFTNATTALGAPVPVRGGQAFLITTTLTTGTHTISAVFTPTDPMALAPSTSSSVSLTVQPLFAGLRF